MVLISQASAPDNHNAISEYLRQTEVAARVAGLDVWPLPAAYEGIPVEDVLGRRRSASPQWALFSGYYYPERYEELERAARRRGVRLINSAQVSRELMEFEHWYPRIASLTARSLVLDDPQQAADAVERLGCPLFVKGSVKSLKEQGLSACLAANAEDLARRLRGAQAQGRCLVVRELLDLRKRPSLLDDALPQAREYRCYYLAQTLLGYGFYWSVQDPFGALTDAEREQMLALANAAAASLGPGLKAIDVGQLNDGSWRVIEVGDLQYSGIAHMPRALFFERLLTALDAP